jgi:hypothetical protein
VTVLKTVGTLAQGAVSTAVSVAKHPIGSAALAAGLVKGVAEAGVGLVRGPHTGETSQERPAPEQASVPEQAAVPEEAAPAEKPEPVAADPRDELPGPDLAHFEPPRPEDLPEPIVIEADDHPTSGNGESGEPFHHEPKVASRDVEHGDGGSDFEQAEGFVDEIPTELRPE